MRCLLLRRYDRNHPSTDAHKICDEDASKLVLGIQVKTTDRLATVDTNLAATGMPSELVAWLDNAVAYRFDMV